MPNVFEPEWDFDIDQSPYVLKGSRVGAQSGSEKLGATLYEVAPGSRVSPLHTHLANEEMIIVVEGRPTLRGEHEARELGPGEVVSCLIGRRGAHRVENNTEEPVRVLIVSTMNGPDICEHLDSNKLLAVMWSPGEEFDAQRHFLAFRKGDAVDRLEGELE